MLNGQVFSVPADHPVFVGHFPGCPIVPGSLILDLVLGAWGLPCGRIVSAKFHAPLGPGETVQVQFESAPDGASVTFRCLRGTDPICSGRLAVAAVP